MRPHYIKTPTVDICTHHANKGPLNKNIPNSAYIRQRHRACIMQYPGQRIGMILAFFAICVPPVVAAMAWILQRDARIGPIAGRVRLNVKVLYDLGELGSDWAFVLA